MHLDTKKKKHIYIISCCVHQFFKIRDDTNNIHDLLVYSAVHSSPWIITSILIIHSTLSVSVNMCT